MLSITSNRKFLIKTPNQIIQQPIELPKIEVKEEKPKEMKQIKKQQKYFLPEFYI